MPFHCLLSVNMLGYFLQRDFYVFINRGHCGAGGYLSAPCSEPLFYLYSGLHFCIRAMASSWGCWNNQQTKSCSWQPVRKWKRCENLLGVSALPCAQTKSTFRAWLKSSLFAFHSMHRAGIGACTWQWVLYQAQWHWGASLCCCLTWGFQPAFPFLIESTAFSLDVFHGDKNPLQHCL